MAGFEYDLSGWVEFTAHDTNTAKGAGISARISEERLRVIDKIVERTRRFKGNYLETRSDFVREALYAFSRYMTSVLELGDSEIVALEAVADMAAWSEDLAQRQDKIGKTVENLRTGIAHAAAVGDQAEVERHVRKYIQMAKKIPGTWGRDYLQALRTSRRADEGKKRTSAGKNRTWRRSVHPPRGVGCPRLWRQCHIHLVIASPPVARVTRVAGLVSLLTYPQVYRPPGMAVKQGSRPRCALESLAPQQVSSCCRSGQTHWVSREIPPRDGNGIKGETEELGKWR